MPLLTNAGIQLVHDAIVELCLLRDSAPPAAATSSSTSTSTKPVPVELSRTMLTESIAMFVRLLDNNSVDYWRVTANQTALVNWLNVLDNHRNNFVPVVFNAESRKLAAIFFNLLKSIDLSKHIDPSCNTALITLLTVTGKDPAKMLKMLTDNLALNIALYDIADSRQKHEAAASDVTSGQVPIRKFLGTALTYVDHLQGKNVITDSKQIAEIREALQVPADCIETQAIYKHIVDTYNRTFSTAAATVDALNIPYSTLNGIDEVVKRREPLPLRNDCDESYFKDMSFNGNKSLLIRTIAMAEQNLEKLIGLPLHGMAEYYRNKYSPDAAEAIYSDFTELTVDLLQAVETYLNPPRATAASFFRHPFAAAKATYLANTSNPEKKAIAERLREACNDALRPTNIAAELLKNNCISSRVFEVFKALLCGSAVHGACVGDTGISFGRLGDIFNDYLLAYYELFTKIDFVNDPYPQAQLELQDDLVLPTSFPKFAAVSSTTDFAN